MISIHERASTEKNIWREGKKKIKGDSDILGENEGLFLVEISKKGIMTSDSRIDAIKVSFWQNLI